MDHGLIIDCKYCVKCSYMYIYLFYSICYQLKMKWFIILLWLLHSLAGATGHIPELSRSLSLHRQNSVSAAFRRSRSRHFLLHCSVLKRNKHPFLGDEHWNTLYVARGDSVVMKAKLWASRARRDPSLPWSPSSGSRRSWDPAICCAQNDYALKMSTSWTE